MSALDELRTRRAAYADAELRILQSQEYQVGAGDGARSNRRAELRSVQDMLQRLDGQIAAAEALAPGGAAGGGGRVMYIR